MNTIDYNNRIIENRDDYRAKAKSLEESHKDEVKHLKENHEYQEAKQSKAYTEDRAKLAAANKDNAEFVSKKSQDIIEGKQKVFKDRVQEQAVDFKNESERLRSDLGGRLRHASESYNDAIKEKDQYFNEKLKHSNGQLEDRLDKNKKQFNEDVTHVTNESRAKSHEAQIGANKEKKDLVMKNEKHLQQVMQDNIKDQNRKSEVHGGQVEALRENRDSEVAFLKEHHGGIQDKSSNEFKKAKEEITSTFQRQNENSNVENRAEILALKKAQNEKVEDINREHGNETRLLKRTKYSGEGSKARDANNQKINHENQVVRYQEVLKDGERQHAINSNQAQVDFEEGMHNQRQNYKKVMNAKDLDREEFVADLNDKNARERTRATELHFQQTKDLNKYYGETLDRETTNRKQMLQNQRDQYNVGIQGLSEHSHKTVNKMNKDFAQEKTDLHDQSKRQIFNEREELQSQQREKMARTEETYEQKLRNRGDESQKVVIGLERSLESLNNKTIRDTQNFNVHTTELTAENAREVRHQLNTKDREHTQTKQQLRDRLEGKISKESFENHREVQKIVDDYEDKIQNMTRDNNLEMKRRASLSRDQYMVLAEQHRLQMEQLRNFYEMKIDKFKLTSEEEKDRLARAHARAMQNMKTEQA